MKKFNKLGDKGETSLLFGQRVAKSSPNCEAYGTLDEAVSALGIARNIVAKVRTKEIIFKVQKDIFLVSAKLATQSQDQEIFASRFAPVTDEMVDQMEEIINELEAEIKLPDSFVIPGANLGSGWLDLSRAIVRRAERKVVVLKESGKTDYDVVLRYLNRLADLLFILARYEEI